jgi:cullin-associated NEDD8-dissociated protein 1
MADELWERGMAVDSFSITGPTAWSNGIATHAKLLDGKRGSIRFKTYGMWRDTISNMTTQKYRSVFSDKYAEKFQETLDESESLAKVLGAVNDASVKSLESKAGNSALTWQLYQVARLIAARKMRKAERDFFFVRSTGWDHHTALATALPDKLKDLDDALADFSSTLEQMKIFDSVTVVTESDFGRTMNFNGKGTDHGWGGNHMILGGSINGGRIYNRFLDTYQLGNNYDAGRGRVIPKHPWESVMVPIAEWMGVQNLKAVFPNLVNFNRSRHIISPRRLFNGYR